MELTRMKVLYDPEHELAMNRQGLSENQSANLISKCGYFGVRILWCEANIIGSLRQIAIAIGDNPRCDELVFANTYDGDVGNLFYYRSEKFGPLMLRMTRSGDWNKFTEGAQVPVDSQFSAYLLIVVSTKGGDVLYKLGPLVQECYLTARAWARTCSQKGVVI